MLTSVPTAINAASRQVVMNHPNSFPCVVSRKQVVRVEEDSNGDPSEMGGNPTLGGIGVLRSEDEAEIEYVELGPAKMLFAAPFQAKDFLERDNALVPETTREVLIESIAKPGADGHFIADSGDLLAVDMGMGVVVAYDVASIPGTVNVAPYTRRYTLNPRDDLSFVPGFDN